MENRILHALLGILLFIGLGQAQALTINFSDMSSDMTDAALLDATLTFNVTSTSGNDLLTLTLENLTTGVNAYTIDELFFNFTGDTAAFSFDSGNTGFGALSTTPIGADGFGVFDVNIMGFALAAGDTEVWQIDLGLAGISGADFNVLSTNPPGDRTATAALKFMQGPGDDSAYGASVVPVPAAAWLFGSGLLGLVGIARRKKA